MNQNIDNKFVFGWRVIVSHILAYSLAGIFAVFVMNYAHLYSVPPLSCFMRPLDSLIVAFGPVLQIFRGIALAFIYWFFRKNLLETKYGYIRIFIVTIGLSYFFTIGPSPGSFESMIYTTFPLKFFYIWLPETIIYTSIFSLSLFFWFTFEKKIFTTISIIVVFALVITNILGFLQAINII